MHGKVFDPNAELLIDEHYRPHWSQAGAIVFITFRTKDSIPKEVRSRWQTEKLEFLHRKGVAFKGDWHASLAQLSAADAMSFRKHFDRQRESLLDRCQGKCLLRNPKLSQIVADSLLLFDGERYHMGDFIIMPNHVHLLVSFPEPERLRKQCSGWLRWTATPINRATGGKGNLWQEEPFDHLVRSAKQLEYLKSYIKENPQKANLKPGEYLLRIEPPA